VLTAAGFTCTRVDRGHTPNLFARWGAKGHPRTFGFNGHTDVVPVGDTAAWTADPFGGEIRERRALGPGRDRHEVGRGLLRGRGLRPRPARAGRRGDPRHHRGRGGRCDGRNLAILDWMKAEGEAMTVCLVGEPTSTGLWAT
jgi:succinyl-diaminopimelate desuccinylase